MIEKSIIQERPGSMVMIPIPMEDWKELTNNVESIKQTLTAESNPSENEWIESTTARKMLGVSPKTWQTYRDNRTIPFVQFGRKILVRRSDIDAFLMKHFVSSTTDNIKG